MGPSAPGNTSLLKPITIPYLRQPRCVSVQFCPSRTFQIVRFVLHITRIVIGYPRIYILVHIYVPYKKERKPYRAIFCKPQQLQPINRVQPTRNDFWRHNINRERCLSVLFCLSLSKSEKCKIKHESCARLSQQCKPYATMSPNIKTVCISTYRVSDHYAPVHGRAQPDFPAQTTAPSTYEFYCNE